MTAPPPAEGKPTIRIRGTAYPVLLPTLRDPRLHLASVIVSLQVLGQVAFGFRGRVGSPTACGDSEHAPPGPSSRRSSAATRPHG